MNKKKISEKITFVLAAIILNLALLAFICTEGLETVLLLCALLTAWNSYFIILIIGE